MRKITGSEFKESELVTRKVKQGNDWIEKTYPVVGGRLRLAHEENEKLNIQATMLSWDGEFATFQCIVQTDRGVYIGHGTANSRRDARLAESLLELAETRSIARALRFAGYGVEYTGAEEVSPEPTSDKPIKEKDAGPQTFKKPEPRAALPKTTTIVGIWSSFQKQLNQKINSGELPPDSLQRALEDTKKAFDVTSPTYINETYKDQFYSFLSEWIAQQKKGEAE